jgi:hypothetical protein
MLQLNSFKFLRTSASREHYCATALIAQRQHLTSRTAWLTIVGFQPPAVRPNLIVMLVPAEEWTLSNTATTSTFDSEHTQVNYLRHCMNTLEESALSARISDSRPRANMHLRMRSVPGATFHHY